MKDRWLVGMFFTLARCEVQNIDQCSCSCKAEVLKIFFLGIVPFLDWCLDGFYVELRIQEVSIRTCASKYLINRFSNLFQTKPCLRDILTRIFAEKINCLLEFPTKT